MALTTVPSSTECAVNVPESNSTRVSVRTRFEIFKRDDFTCKYCGRKSPEVVLEVDHIVPRCEGGSNDPINLITACWDCNRGKAGIPLNEVVTAEDPHDRAVVLLERERQLREYNAVLESVRLRKEYEADKLTAYWTQETGSDLTENDYTWLLCELDKTAMESIQKAMLVAIGRWKVRDLRYVNAVLTNWRNEGKL